MFRHRSVVDALSNKERICIISNAANVAKGAIGTMCYSLEASVNAGVCLAIVGAGVVRKALRFDRKMLAFACFPLVFSVHQFIEGAVSKSCRLANRWRCCSDSRQHS